MKYAAYLLDENGYKLWTAYINILGQETPLKHGDIFTAHDGKQYWIDFQV